MAEPGAKDGRDHQIRSLDFNIFGWFPFLFINSDENLSADEEGQNQEKAIPAQRELTPGKQFSAFVPQNVANHG